MKCPRLSRVSLRLSISEMRLAGQDACKGLRARAIIASAERGNLLLLGAVVQVAMRHPGIGM